MKCRDRQGCQTRYEREVKQARDVLERFQDGLMRLRPEQRLVWERRLDDLRGSINRATGRLEGLRRSGDNWRTAAAHADEAFMIMAQGLAALGDAPSKSSPLAA